MSRSRPLPRILLVESDAAHGELIQSAFESWQDRPAELRIVRSLVEASAEVERHPPDLLITELSLPDGSGFELLRKLGSRDFPTIVVSGHGDPRSVVRAMRAGALEYVVKSAETFDALPQIATRSLREWQLTEERARLQEELRATQQAEEIGRIAGGMAHGFNNLLTIIGPHLELIEMAAPDNPEIEESAGEIWRAYRSATSLTRQMLAFGGRRVLEPARRELNDAVRGVGPVLSRVLGEDHVLELVLTECPCPVEFDVGPFEEVLAALLLNARDAMKGGGTITLSTTTASLTEPVECAGGSLPPGEYVRITVTDSGRGMSPLDRRRAFEPFFTTKPPGSGMGLGLSSAFGIVRQLRGDIRLESEPGAGTSASVFLPLALTDADREAAAAPPSRLLTDGGETILVADDDPGILSLVERLLTARGYKVYTAVDGKGAIDILEGRGPDIDLLVTDSVMPQASGEEVVEWLDGFLPELRTLFISSKPDGLSGQRLDPRKARYLAKPFSSRSLRETVRELLDARDTAAS